MLFSVLKGKNCQPVFLYTMKKLFVDISYKENLEFSTSRPSLKQQASRIKTITIKDVFKQQKLMAAELERCKKE